MWHDTNAWWVFVDQHVVGASMRAFGKYMGLVVEGDRERQKARYDGLFQPRWEW
jgi:hypothetical protein